MLPRDTGAPPPTPQTSEIFSTIFGLFTIENNRSESINGWQIAFVFADPPPEAQLSEFKGALPLVRPS